MYSGNENVICELFNLQHSYVVWLYGKWTAFI